MKPHCTNHRHRGAKTGKADGTENLDSIKG